jgi:Ca-activated chloride channel family protein
LTLKIRYKDPDGSQSKLLEVPLVDAGKAFSSASMDYRFAASVAAFGMILRDSPYKGNASLSAVIDMAEGSKGTDSNGYRQEFIGLVNRARSLMPSTR